MNKFINILSTIISEQKRYKFDPKTYAKFNGIVDNLWNDRKINYKGKTLVDVIPLTLASGVEGLVKIIVNPKLPYIGYMGTRPKKSLDPADMYIEVNPKHYQSKKNLYLTLYHEMIHASDPTQSYLWTPSYEASYNPKFDELYWGHPIEFFAITNEFLEGLVLEFKRRTQRIKNLDNKKYLLKSFNNILNYFAKGEPLSKLSTDIIRKINDENVMDNKLSKLFAEILDKYPEVSELLPQEDSKDVPYFLHYIELIKKFNPKIWPRFLTMFYKTKDEIEDILK